LLQTRDIGAVLVEPVQVRGGVNIPGSAFLPMLRSLCDEFGALLVLDEIYTGLGRTGKWFACEHFGVVPDLVCLGKALSGGFPLSACVGRAPLMDAAWPPAQGEAIHTSTFLGHPVGCAMALAQIEELRSRDLVRQSAARGAFLLAGLEAMPDHWELSGGAELFIAARGLGLLAGLELRRARGTPATQQSLRVIQELLARGFILLPEGEHANVISFTPPLTISERQLAAVLTALRAVLERLA
jgi:4-aminobutyrate aminotransferase-like enzyme